MPLAAPLPDGALAFVEPVAETPIRLARCHPKPGRIAPSMGVDAYLTNQTSRNTFRAYQSAVTVKMPPPSALNCRPLNHVPPLHWVLPPVKCRPLSKSHTRFCRASTPLATPLPDAALAFVEPVAGPPIRSARFRPRPGRMAPSPAPHGAPIAESTFHLKPPLCQARSRPCFTRICICRYATSPF